MMMQNYPAAFTCLLLFRLVVCQVADIPTLGDLARAKDPAKLETVVQTYVDKQEEALDDAVGAEELVGADLSAAKSVSFTLFTKLDAGASTQNFNASYLVTPIKAAYGCISGISISIIAAYEVCYNRLTGAPVAFSGQELIDCAGAPFNCANERLDTYLQWIVAQGQLASLAQYPFKNSLNDWFKCPPTLPVYNPGVVVSGAYYTNSGSETLLAVLVSQRSVALTTLRLDQSSFASLFNYQGNFNILDNCVTGSIEVTVLVVGSFTSGGVSYWRIQHLGRNWGENGYFRLRRGVRACAVGDTIAVIDCGYSESYQASQDEAEKVDEEEGKEGDEEEEIAGDDEGNDETDDE